MSGRDPSTSTFEGVTFVLEGPIDVADRERAEAEMMRVVAKSPRPVLFARMKMFMETQRSDEEQAMAQGLLDVSGALIRAEASAPTVREAVDVVVERLDRRLRRLSERREDARDRPPQTPEGEWRAGDLPASRPSFFPRPPEERQVVRHKTFAPKAISVEEAIFDLDVLDFRFFLFTDQADGEESVVYENEQGDVVLRRASGGRPSVDRPVPVAVNESPAPGLTVDEAATELGMSDQPFVFFRNEESGHAAALYRRYDGHYGLVEPRI